MTEIQFQAIVDKLDELRGEFKEFKGAKDVQVSALEKKLANQEFWENVKVVAVMPIMAVFHHYWGGK
jgi:hypothetical protein